MERVEGVGDLEFPSGDLETFIYRVKSLNGDVIVRETLDELFEEVINYLFEKKIKRVVLERTPLLSNFERSLSPGGFEILSLLEVVDAEAGITEAVFGIGETGTVLVTGENSADIISLLPPVHIAFLKRELILPSILDGIKFMEQRRIFRGVFISGPSRTADIEQTLTVGVHGPQNLLIAVYG